MATLSHANIIAIVARALARVSTRVIVREANTLSRVAGDGASFRQRLTATLVGWFYPRANGVVAVSEGVASDLVENAGLSSDAIRVIYNPVSIADVRRMAEDCNSHGWFKPDMRPLVLGVGSLTPKKDFSTLIRAFAMVRKDIDARLVILGEGGERDQLVSLAKDLGVDGGLQMPGFVDNPYAVMARASVFVLSSSYEGLPNVLLQAMAVGSPVVATDCPSGPREILDGSRFGPLVPVGDAEALAWNILEVLQSPPNIEPLQRRAEDFALDHIALEYLSYILPT